MEASPIAFSCPRAEHGRNGAALEQVGRVIDHLGGDLSKSEAFQKAYQADLAALTKEDHIVLTLPDIGAAQAFAHTFAWSIGDRAKLDPLPHLRAYWESQIALEALKE